MDSVLGWLSLAADQRPDLITLYFDEPDTTGHKLGPEPTNGVRISYWLCIKVSGSETVFVLMMIRCRQRTDFIVLILMYF